METGRVFSSESDETNDDEFGRGIALGSDFTLIGAFADDDAGDGSGSVYVFDNDYADCNVNGVDDDCEVTLGVHSDCNQNGIPDDCDIAGGASDCTLDGRPDECDPDCNANAVADSCDLAAGMEDCNRNSVLDQCEPPFECVTLSACHLKRTGFNGSHVAMDGDWAVTGAGFVVIYHRVGRDWTYSFQAPPGTVTDVAISGDRFVAIANGAFVYRRTGTTWNVEATFPAYSPVAMDGDVILADREIFRFTGSSWASEAVLAHSDPIIDDLFGYSLALDGDYAIVGAPQHGPSIPHAGAAYVFHREGGTWVQEAKLTSSQPVTWGRFGESVALRDDIAVVGEPGDDCYPQRTGRVSIFRRNGQVWNEMDVFDSGDPIPAGEQFGGTVATDGTQIVVRTHVFELDGSGNFWIYKHDLRSVLPWPSSDYPISDAAVSGDWSLLGSGIPADTHFLAVSGDCNLNGIADVCDIQAGNAPDMNNDGVIDGVCFGCPDYPLTSWDEGPRAEPHPSLYSFGPYVPKNRYVSFIPPGVPAGASGIALRVTLGPMPGPADCPKIPDFSASNGAAMWVGPEVMAGSTPTGVYRLQETPFYQDWSTGSCSVIHVSDCNIVPCATYTIEAVTDGGLMGPPLQLSTTPVWGDVIGQNGGPSDGVVNAVDIVALVTRFREVPGAAPRSWCDLHGNDPTQGSRLNIDALDITLGVDAFKGSVYPFSGPTAPAACP